MKGDDRYFGRDALYGSSALARKVETVILISLTNREDAESVRQYEVMPRNGKPEKMYMKWEHPRGLVLTEKPPDPEPVKKVSKAMRTWRETAFTNSSPVMRLCIHATWGPKARSTVGVMTPWTRGQVVQHSGGYFMAASGTGVVTSA